MKKDASGPALTRILRNSDFALAVVLVGVVGALFIPIPSGILSFLVVANILIAFVILITSTQVESPLEFSSFPALLQITAMSRIALNVSAAKLILADADAGPVIHALGSFAVRGDIIIGMVVFGLVFIIQLLVVTAGAARSAEVSARFHLDALPAKQLAIDTDLANGVITKEELADRRSDLQREADFYGAMDGASKFVKGDAIVGVIVLMANIVGGFLVGLFRHGYDIGQSLQTYATLAVGDGLATIIPAFMISIATGMLVARTAEKEGLGSSIFTQLLDTSPRIFYIAGGVLAILGLVVAEARLPFWVFAAVAGGFGVFLRYDRSVGKRDAEEASRMATAAASRGGKDATVLDTDLFTDELSIDVGTALAAWAQGQLGESDRMDRPNLLYTVKKAIAEELGLLLPRIDIVDNQDLDPHEYAINVRGETIAKGNLRADRIFVWNATPDFTIDKKFLELTGGVYARGLEPTTGLEGVWVDPSLRETAELAFSYMVLEPIEILRGHFRNSCTQNASRILSRASTQRLLEMVKSRDEQLANDVLNPLSKLNLSIIHRVLQGLLVEGVPIKDMSTILETLLEKAATTQNVDDLIKMVRRALSGTISSRFADANGTIWGLGLSPRYRQLLGQSLGTDEDGRLRMAAAPEVVAGLVDDITRTLVAAGDGSMRPYVLLADESWRLALARLLRRAIPHLPVISYTELTPQVNVEVVLVDQKVGAS